MTTQAEVLSNNLMLVRSEQLIESLANQSQRKKVSDAGICKYPDLNLDWEIPWG